MSYTTVENILQTLHEEMIEKINPSNGYRSDPVAVLFGAFSYNEVKDTPVIGFDITSEDYSLEFSGDDNTALLNVDVYGYAYTDGVDRISCIRDLAHDVLNFIYNDFSYTDDTIIPNKKIEYGGNKLLVFRIPIGIYYEYNNDNIG